jgi:hypothetical protein
MAALSWTARARWTIELPLRVSRDNLKAID